MRFVRWQPTLCERAGQWLSLELDDEISETERVALDRHLARCADCRARRVELRAITGLLRSAPAIAPERPVRLPAPRLRARVRRFRPAGVAVALAAAAAAAVAVVIHEPQPSSSALVFRNSIEQRRYAAIQNKRAEPIRATSTVVPPAPLASIPLSMLR